MREQENIDYDSATGRHHDTFDPTHEPGSEAVVSSLSELTGTDVDKLESFDAVVDPIVFDALVRRHRRPVQISFEYHDHEVTVDTGGDIWIHKQGDHS